MRPVRVQTRSLGHSFILLGEFRALKKERASCEQGSKAEVSRGENFLGTGDLQRGSTEKR